MEIMRAASANRIDEDMRYFQAGFFDLGGQEVYVSRHCCSNKAIERLCNILF